MERFSATPMLLNLQALAHMQMGQFEEAERQLTQALTRAPGDADALANMVSCLLQLRKPAETIARYQRYRLSYD